MDRWIIFCLILSSSVVSGVNTYGIALADDPNYIDMIADAIASKDLEYPEDSFSQNDFDAEEDFYENPLTDSLADNPPKYNHMIVEAIKALEEQEQVPSQKAIINYIKANYDVGGSMHVRQQLNLALKKAIIGGFIREVKGAGVGGAFTLTGEAPEETAEKRPAKKEPSKRKPSKKRPTKERPSKKKTAAKKPAAKEAAKKKEPAAKKTAKKPAAKKPAAKKAAAKKPAAKKAAKKAAKGSNKGLMVSVPGDH